MRKTVKRYGPEYGAVWKPPGSGIFLDKGIGKLA